MISFLPLSFHCDSRPLPQPGISDNPLRPILSKSASLTKSLKESSPRWASIRSTQSVGRPISFFAMVGAFGMGFFFMVVSW